MFKGYKEFNQTKLRRAFSPWGLAKNSTFLGSNAIALSSNILIGITNSDIFQIQAKSKRDGVYERAKLFHKKTKSVASEPQNFSHFCLNFVIFFVKMYVQKYAPPQNVGGA